MSDRALVDTSVLIAQRSAETLPDLSGFAAVFTSSICFSELEGGIPAASGQVRAFRVARLAALHRLYGDGLPYNDHCAREHGHLTEVWLAAGRGKQSHILDRMIAATAVANDMTLITRNAADFLPMAGTLRVEVR